MLPSKTLASQEETSPPGFKKKSKARFSILVCSNTSGEDKLLLLVTGKSVKPSSEKCIFRFITHKVHKPEISVN